MRAITTWTAILLSGLLTTAALAAPLGASPTASSAGQLASTGSLVAALSTVPKPPADNPIRIGLAWGLARAEVGGSNGLWIIIGGVIQDELPAGMQVTLSASLGGLQVGDLFANPGDSVRLVPKTPGYITYNGKSYRGEVEAVLTPLGRLSVVNLLNLEEYLLGVVPLEMPSSWPTEALKAQSVAARTYALVNRGRRSADGFDLRNTTDDQVYGGIQAERPSTNDAVTQTVGQVVTLNGKPVATFFHASSGGHTENNEDIWTGGSPLSYLRGVPDYDNLPENRWTSWRYEYSPEEFGQRLSRAGYGVGQVESITPGAVGASGRPTRWTVVGSTGQVTLTMQQMRTSLGLPAPARSITLEGEGGTTPEPQPEPVPVPIPPQPPEMKAAPVYALGASGVITSRPLGASYVISANGLSQLPAEMKVAMGSEALAIVGKLEPVQESTPPPANPQTPSHPQTPSTPQNPSNPQSPTPTAPTLVLVEGSGSGHGVGLSQWGANGMARMGIGYAEILSHFYTGTKVETR